MKSKPLLFAIVLVLSIAFANAFTVESNLLSNVVCPSATIVIEEKITADKAASFEVVTAGSANSFATALPIAFDLAKGESKSVYVYITPPSDVLPGNYELLVTIANGYETKQVKHDIVVENCNELTVRVEPEKEVCACESITYKATLTNNGLYRERYSLELFGDAASFAKLSTDSIALNPGESKDFLIYFNPSCEVEKDTYTFTIKATSLDSRAIALTEGSIKVNNCFSYALDAEKNFYSICDGDKATAKVYLENRGASANLYDINFKGPAFSHIDKNSVELNPNGKAELNIYLNPRLGEKADNYTLKIETLSDKGKILAREEITVEVRECHNAEIAFMFEKEKDKLCNALTNTYGIELKNLGEKQGDYAISVDGPEWVRLSNTSIKLDANKTASLWLEVSPPYGTKADSYSIKVTARDRNSEIAVSDEIEIETLTKVDCYKPKINVEESSIEVEKDKTHVAIFTIENTGARKASYLIDVSGNANRFVSVTPSVIELEPGKAENVYVYIAPTLTTPTGKYSLTLSARLNDTTMLASKTISIDVIEPKEIETEKPVNVTNITVEEKPKQEKSLWQKVVDWFKSLFKPAATLETGAIVQEAEETQKAIEEVVNESNKTETVNISENLTSEQEASEIVEAIANESVNESQEKTIEEAKGGSEVEFRETLAKYKWPIIVVLAIIALILLLSIFDVWKKIFK